MHHGIHLIKIHFAVILYVLGNACYMWSPSGKTDRPQFRLCKEKVFLYELFTSSENYV